MRRFSITLISILQISNLVAQSNAYHPLPEKNVAWLQQYQTGSGNTGYIKYEMNGDTLFDGKMYKKLYQTQPSSMYYQGSVRQDIKQKKVFFCPAGGKEQLLYNFDLAIGDTVNGADANDTLTVQKIDSALVGNEYHRVFRLKSAKGLGAGELIEGVGHSGGFLSHYEYVFEFGSKLLCFSVNNERLFPIKYPGDPYTCLMTVGITEWNNDKLIITASPNPATDMASILVDCKSKYSIQLRNMLGQVIYTVSDLDTPSLNIDLSRYETGIYYIQLHDSKGNTAVKKIMKQ